MRRTATIVVLIVVIAAIAAPLYYVSYCFMSVTASTEQLILSSNETPGWTLVDHSDITSGQSTIPGLQEWSYRTYGNSSAVNDSRMGVSVLTFLSSDSAHDYYSKIASGSSSNFSIKDVNGAGENSYVILKPDPSNYSISVPFTENEYFVLIDNVVIRMSFEIVTPSASVNDTVVPEPWMSELVVLQVDKVKQNTSLPL